MGFILLLLPFLLLFFFKNKIFGFASILSWIIFGHVLIALTLQGLYIFTHTSVLIAVSLFDVILLYVYRKRVHSKITLPHVDYVALVVIILSIIYLGNVHYNYTGKYTTAVDFTLHTGEHVSYPYPYYSDEWDAIAYIQNATEHETLPTYLPFTDRGEVIINYEIAFHSLASEIFVLLDADPAINYVKASIIINALLVLLVYLFLRSQNVLKIAAATAALLVLFITNGANLPGLWTLLPLTLGMITLLLGCIFFSYKNTKWYFAMYVLIMLLYPPYAIFYLIALITYTLVSKDIGKNNKIENISYAVLLSIAMVLLFMKFIVLRDEPHPITTIMTVLNVVIITAMLLLVYFRKSLKKIQKYIVSFSVIYISLNIILFFFTWETQQDGYLFFLSHIIYESFTGKFIPQYSIYNIIPEVTLALGTLGGIILAKKRHWILPMVISGLSIWMLYSQIEQRFIIEYQRNVFATSILITILSGFGFHYVVTYAQRFNALKNKKIITIAVLAIFFLLSLNYTKRDNWNQLFAIHRDTGRIVAAAAPANKYLHPDDLKLFSDIHNSTFLSLPWKGTVLGVLTDNYPISIKAGTISMNTNLYTKFVQANCQEKTNIINEYDIEYVYSPEFDCKSFNLLNTSAEGLSLYRVNKAFFKLKKS